MSDSSESKLHVDEDWKSQVEAEKQKARERTPIAADDIPGGEPAATNADTSTEKSAGVPRGDLPPPTLEFLISTLASQSMVALGAVANPFTGKAETDLPQARHFIDMLAMLDEKTRGNRTDRESAVLESLLHQLRMAFVEIERGGG